MAINWQPININFSQGLDLKTDPWQVQPGKFLSLQNSIFTKAGLLQKRNGFNIVTTATGASTIATFNNSLVTLGNESLQAYSADTELFTNTGFLQPLSLTSVPLVRAATSQTTVDTAIASNGLACSVWLDADTNCYYQISDSVSGQTIIPKVELPSGGEMPRVFSLGNYFMVTFLINTTHLQYIAVPISNPSNPGTATDLATTVVSTSSAYDGIVANNNLYIAWAATSTIGLNYVTSQLVVATPISLAGNTANLISMTADTTGNNPIVWLSWYNSSSNVIKAAAYNYQLNATPLLGATTVVSSVTVNELASTATGAGSTGSVLHSFYEVANTYGFSPNAKTDYVSKNSLTIGGTAGTPAIINRGIGLGSKAIRNESLNKSFMFVVYGQTYQPTYFLMDDVGNIIEKHAYSNGAGYAINQILPSIYVSGTTASPIYQCGYLYKDLIAAVNSQGTPNAAGLTPSPAGIYSQTGINLISITFNSLVYNSQIGGSLHIGAGFMWQYDGTKPVEHQFHVWPEDVGFTTATTGGFLSAQIYYYQACYEWTDNAGNIHRSAPSVPLEVDIHTSGTSTNVNTIYVPTLRLTYKTTNKVRIVLYRWSTAQQNYYQVTSVASPTLNNPAVDYVTITDTLADSTILGNNLIYTTGGVVEDIAGPASIAQAIFDDRLWLVDAEDQNLLWFSKQVIEGTPVEFSDLFTMFIAPSLSAQGSTGPITAIYPMDDKLIIFKKDAMYYISGIGQGPDNTGANNQYNGPIFIVSTVGTTIPNSIVLTPMGLMFQSDKGIWLLDRNLGTTYIGQDVESFTTTNIGTAANTVTSAICVPDTNQVRFTMSNNITLMYDYFYGQWGTFTNTPAISSVVYQDLHTYLNPYGQILQETPGQYLDITTPVLLSFKTSWFKLSGLQGYERFREFYLIGTYISPHFLQVQIAYDYAPVAVQQSIIMPNNYTGVYGNDPTYGFTSPYGGTGTLEQWRIHANNYGQTCESFQIAVNEVSNTAFGTVPGAGFTLSGINCTVGFKKGRKPIRAINSVG